MAVGLGAGVNLGAFTAFLFIDGTGLQRGLIQADKAMGQFIAKQQQLATRAGQFNVATAAADQMRALQSQLRSAQFVKFEQESARAAAQASSAIVESYRRRAAALSAFKTAAAIAKEAMADLEREVAAIEKERARTARQAARAEKQIARFVPSKPGDQAALEQMRTNLKLTEQTMDRLGQLAAKRGAELKKVQEDFRKFAEQTAAAITKANKVQEQSIDQLRRKLGEQLNAYKQLAQQAGPEFTRLSERIERTGKRVITAALEVGKARVEAIEAQRERQTAGPFQLAKAVEREERAARRLQAAMNSFRAARRAHQVAEEEFARRFDIVTKRRADAAQREALRVQQAMEQQQIAAKQLRHQQLGAAFNAIQVAAFTAGAALSGFSKSFLNFNEIMTRVAAIDEEIAANFDEVSRRVQDLAITFGKAPADIANALNTIVQADIQGAEAFQLLEVAVRASVAGFADVNDAVRPLIGFMNAYGASVDEAARASDILFQGVTAGIFTFQELAGQLGDNLSLASSLGVSLEELSAAYIVLTKRSNSLSESTTQVNALMNQFLKATQDLNAEVKKRTGLTAAEFLKQKGLTETLKLTAQIIEDLGEAQAGRLIVNVRALRAVMGLTARSAEDFARELEGVQRAQEGAGRTSAVLKRTMESVVFPVRQAQAAIQVMGQNLAASIAPGIIVSARAVRFFAEGLISLNDITRGAVGIMLGLTATALVGSVAFLRLFVASRDVIRGLRAMKQWLLETRVAAMATTRAMLILRAAMSPIGLAFIALASAASLVILHHRKQQKEARALKEAYEALEATSERLGKRRDITAEEARQLNALQAEVVDTIKVLNDLEEEIDEAASRAFFLEVPQEVTKSFDEQGNTIEKVTLRYHELTKMLDQFLSKKEETRLLEDLRTIFETEGLAVELVTQRINELLESLRKGKITPDEFAAAIHDMAENTDTLTREFQELENGAVRLGTSLVFVSELLGTDMTSRTEALGSALKEATRSILTLAGVLPDVSNPLAFIQSQLGSAGETALQTAHRLAAVGQIRLTDAEREAVRLAATVDSLRKKIDDTRQSINKHEAAINDWEGIITLLNNNVGRQANGFKQLAELAERYGLTQEEVNRIQEAAIFLNERAKIGIEDERLAIARSLPDLAQFVAQHDAAVQKYEELDPAARGAAEAIKDAKNQAALMAVIMLKLANAMHPEAFPDELVTTFIADISAADPVLASLLDRYGLIPTELKTTIAVDVPQRTLTTIEEVDAAIAKTRQQLDALRSVPMAGPADVNKIITDLEDRIKRLEKLRQDIEIGVIVEPNELPKLESGIEDTVKDGEDEAAALQRAWSDAFDAMRDDPIKVSRGLAEALPQLAATTGLVKDLSDPLQFLSESFGLTERSIFNVILAMGRLEGTPIRLDASEQQALRLAARLEDVDRNLERLSGEIQQNTDDMSMWQQRISLVDETVGKADDGYDRLNQLLRTGRITQEEYNRILAAAVWLRERSIGGVLDERAEIAKSLPDLAAYVQMHDHLDGAYKKLTPQQRGFIAALQDQNTQVLLSTALLIAQLEAIGAAAPGATQKFIDLASKTNEVFGAIARDIGLLPDEKDLTVDVSVQADPAALRGQLPDEPIGSVDVNANIVLPESFSLPNDVAVNVDVSAAQASFNALAEHATKVLSGIVEDSPAFGLGAGMGWTSGMATGVRKGSAGVNRAIAFMQQTVLANASRNAARYGEVAGIGFGFGIARGILSNQSQGAIVAAARYVALLAYFSALTALQIRSPSRRGQEIGTRFVEGIVAGIQSSATTLIRSVRDVAESAGAAFEAAVKPGFATPVIGRTMGPGTGAHAPRVINISVPMHVENHISGMDSPERAAEIITDSVWQRLSGGINRLIVQIDGATP